VNSINILKSRFLNLGSEVQVLSGTPFEIKGIIGMIKATYCAWVTPG